MTVFIIANGYPTEKYRGVGIFELDQAKALAAKGHQIVYLAVDLRSIRRWRKWGFESLVKDNVEIRAINIPLGRFQIRYCIFSGLLACLGYIKELLEISESLISFMRTSLIQPIFQLRLFPT